MGILNEAIRHCDRPRQGGQIMDFKDAEWQLNRTMGQLGRLAKKLCHYSGMGINPECFSCDGLDVDCAGYVTTEDFKAESMTKGDTE